MPNDASAEEATAVDCDAQPQQSARRQLSACDLAAARWGQDARAARQENIAATGGL